MAQEAQWGGGAAMTEKQLQALIELRRKLHEIFLMDGNQELLQAETISDL